MTVTPVHLKTKVSCWKLLGDMQIKAKGGAVAKWLVCWTPDLAVQVRALAVHCVLGQDTLLSYCLSPPRRTLNGKWRVYYWGKPCDGLASHPGEGGGKYS